VGKSTILGEVLKEKGVVTSISCTTRKPRPGEKEGEEYFFLTKEEFMKRAGAGEMAEHAEVFGNLYGTPKAWLLKNLSAGKDVITDIDVQGAKQLKKSFPGAVMIFVVPPTRKVLEERLRARHTDDEPSMRRRLETAEKEMAVIDMYDYVVVNDVLAEAAQTVSAIRRAEHAKRNRIKEEYRW
jgi:guanylate kinase